MASSSITQDERKQLAAKGQAMPDGRYPMRTPKDVKDAIGLVGHAGGPATQAAVRRLIMRCAKKLGCPELIPNDWNPDGTVKDDEPDNDAD